MKNLYLISILLMVLSGYSAQARPIISGISANEINIDTKFTGAEVLLFGAKGDAGDIIVTIRGPRKDYLVSKKSKFLDIWYNKDRLKFKNTYSYYAFFSSNSESIIDPKLLSELEIGEDQINFNISGDRNTAMESEFKIEFADKLEQKNLYSTNHNSIEFLDETLFKVMLKFPKNVARGVYIVEIYLVDENNLVAFQSIPIKVHQVGISAEIDQFAHDRPVLYGICAVLMAVIAGFVANYIFTKLFNK
ncbi:MAG: hypothetical protein K0R25_1316 [Rickettsiaceae bacterium]|jgi:uncharacterized protein (TIGR02186 family)|nr:hypothetical protein [Rickettsiaceae bacterium]